jgi:CHAT domain-containing protein
MIQPIKSAVAICHSILASSKNGLLLFIIYIALLVPTVAGHAHARSCETLDCLQSSGDANSGVSIKVTDAPALEQGKPIERKLAGGEAHPYRLMLTAGQFCHVVVDQRGIDVAVALYRPDGERVVEVDSPTYRNGPELLSLLAEASGSYRLEVRSVEKNAPAGSYGIKIEELRAATTRDKSRIVAQTAFTDAKSLRNQRTAESFRRAIGKYQEALSFWRTVGDRRMEAYSLNEMGLIYGDLSEYQKALDSLIEAHATYKLLGDLRSQAGMLSNIGWIYGNLGEYQKSVDFHEQALEAHRGMGDRFDEPRSLSNIGSSYSRLGEYQKALDIHLRVLSMRRAGGDRAGQAITLNNIGNCYEHLGEKRKALDYYGQALTLMPLLADVFYTATTLNNIGTVYRDLGEHQKALDYFSQALQLRRTIGDQSGEAATLSQIARLERDRGNLVEARNRIEAALATVESLRANVASQQLRASFFASVRQYHEFNIDLLMRLRKQRPSEGFDAAALHASERSRARSLLELLKEARAEIRHGLDPALLERERTLRQTISEKADLQMRMLRGKHTEEQAAAAAKEIDVLTTEYEQMQAQIRHTSPRYGALTEPAPLTLKQIQTEVLDDETLLLEYALGEEKSFLWAASPTSIKSFELPKRSEIESVARRVYEILTARNRIVNNETPDQRRERIGGADAEYGKASLALSQILLGPVAAEIKGKRLLIVGEGMLQYTAFAALPTPDSRPGVVSSPLIAEHEIISLPSASVLAVLRREALGRPPPDKTVAVLADPVFDTSDPRVAGARKNRMPAVEPTASTSDVKRSATESGLRNFARLRFSRQEAEQIARFASEGKRLEAVDFDASLGLATNSKLAQYAIVHFATHGLINNQHPELSGIVLSLVDEQGRPRNGFLRLYDIYNLKLEADLVVLSACQTALGKQIKGEGLVGLTRGFMYAGATRVVASVWQVDDRATAQLMGRFYEAMLGQGLRPAAALRAAQVSMMKDRRWQAPYYWAAFSLQGEWK